MTVWKMETLNQKCRFLQHSSCRGGTWQRIRFFVPAAATQAGCVLAYHIVDMMGLGVLRYCRGRRLPPRKKTLCIAAEGILIPFC
jgi:hypothetical protein